MQTTDTDDPMVLRAEIARLTAEAEQMDKDNDAWSQDNWLLVEELDRAKAREKALKAVIETLERDIEDLRLQAKGLRPTLSRDYNRERA